MATENVGGIQYTVDADTAAMLKAEAVVNKSISKQVKDFDKADTAVRTFIATQEKLGRTVNSMGQVMNANGKIVANATTQYRTLATNAQSGFSTLNTQVSGTAKAVRSARPDMQNMSYQLQDMAVQAQMGTSAFVIMAQQLPQMLVGMGAWAGAIGVAVTVLGLLATVTIDTSTNMDKFEQSLERVKAVITIGANGVANYSEEMQKLSTISEALTRIRLQNALAEQTSALKNNAVAMRDAWEEAGSLFDQTSSGVIGEIISDKDQKALKELSGDFNSGKISAEEFNKEAGKIKDAMSGVNLIDKGIKNIGYSSEEAKKQGVDQLVEGLGLLSTSAAQNTKQGRELISSVTDLVQKYKEGTLTIEALKDALNGTTDAFDKNADSIKDLTNEFTLNAIRITEGERAAFKFGLQLKGLDADQVKAQMSLYDYNKELEQTKSDAEEAEEALKNVNDELDAFFDKESADDKKKAERETTSNINFAQNIIESGETPEQRMAEQYARLNELRQTDLENAELYQDAMTSLEQQAAQNREDLLGESYKRIGQQAADSMGDYLAGVETAEDATRMLASTILSEVIQSLVQMGMSAVTQSLTTTTAATTGIAATTGAAVTSTGVMAGAQSTAMATVAGAVGGVAGGLATAWAPAAAFASLATLGTNSGPAIAGIYATMAATLGAQLVGGLASNAIEAGTGFAGANMSGAREFGGPVTAGKSYLVGERGPEMFTPGSSGGITSNKDMASGGQMNVIINNNAAGVDVSANQVDQRTVEISVRKSMQEFANQASTGQGVAINALTRNTNVTRKGGV